VKDKAGRICRIALLRLEMREFIYHHNCHIKTEDQTMMQKKSAGIGRVLLVLCALCPGLNAIAKAASTFYVAPNGRDDYPGTLQKPFATIAQAQNAVRRINATMDQDITVYVRGGRYILEKPLHFDHRDSGRNGFTISYQAYRNEIPEISAGQPVEKWLLGDHGLYTAKVDGAFRQLYVNGVRCIRARTPNVGRYYRLKFWNERDREIIIAKELIQPWAKLNQVEMIVQMHWAEAVLPLASLETHGEYAYIAPQEPERDLVFRRLYPIKSENEAFHFENDLSFIDQPGEWHCDSESGTLYYQPRLPQEEINQLQAVVPRLERVLHIDGTLEKPVHHIRFRGLCLCHAGWNLPRDTGMLNSQAGQYAVKVEPDNRQYLKRPPAAVYVTAAHHLTFERNVFCHLGATALDLHYGTHNNLIIGNVFYDIAGSGILYSKFSEEQELHTRVYNPADQREICRNDTISNNLLTRIGQDYPGCCGIACGFPQAVVIEHNELYDMPYSGISVGWAWMDADNVMRDNQVRYNRIHHVLQLLCDGGAIYTLSRQPNSFIKENYIHDIDRSPWAVGSKNNGIFLDQGSSGLTLEHNVFERLQEEPIRHHATGTIIQIQNDTNDRSVIEQAGLEKEYRNLSKLLK